MSILIRTVWNNVKYGLIPIMSKPFPNFYLRNKIIENLKAIVFYLRNEEPQMSKKTPQSLYSDFDYTLQTRKILAICAKKHEQ